MPGADRADEISARLLAIVLADEGIAARALSRGETRRLEEVPAPDVIVISAIPPDAVAHARHVCKRARAQFESPPIIVGLWQAEGDLLKSRQRLEPAGAARLVTSFSACISQLRAIVSGELKVAESAPQAPTPPVLAVQPRARA